MMMSSHDHEKRTFSGRQRILLETNKARDTAEILLNALLKAQRVFNLPDTTELTKYGREARTESINTAVRSTRRLIDALNRALTMAEEDVDDCDLQLLDELDAELDALFDDEDFETLALIDDLESLQSVIEDRPARTASRT